MITLLIGINYLLFLYRDQFALSREQNIFLEDIGRKVVVYAFIPGVDQKVEMRGN
jgi:hypothetical protein